MRDSAVPALALAVVAALAACDVGGDGGSQDEVAVGARAPVGGPLPGLSAAELAAFERGKVLFGKRFTPSEGLGPLYNTTSCEACHSTPEAGGSSQLYRNFYVAMYGAPSFMVPIQGLPSAVVPAYGAGQDFALARGRKVIPDPGPGVLFTTAQRNALPLFGIGLFEFVSDATIRSHADPDDLDGDGISGRFNTDFGGSIGRFGAKAQSNNIEIFTRAPLRNQMGITSDPFLGGGAVVSASSALVQVAGDPNLPTVDNDSVPDPEISRDDLGDLIAFTRFLAPPSRVLPLSAAAVRGEERFESLGCTLCHVPSLPSSRGPVDAYTDLLIHDMGPALADGLTFGIPQASSISPPTSHLEFRTQPLWGVSLHAPYLHDGRAETLQEAIVMHDGEAQTIREAYEALTPAEQADVIEFLEHL